MNHDTEPQELTAFYSAVIIVLQGSFEASRQAKALGVKYSEHSENVFQVGELHESVRWGTNNNNKRERSL